MIELKTADAVCFVLILMTVLIFMTLDIVIVMIQRFGADSSEQVVV